MQVPPYYYESDNVLVIGEDGVNALMSDVKKEWLDRLFTGWSERLD